MPTPFYHLSIADNLLHHPALSGAMRSLLSRQSGAFFLGNTAPDVQVISGQNRQSSHFFGLPVRRNSQLPWEKLLSAHPTLRVPAALPPAQTAFVAGYLSHLLADWLWVVEIFAPIFGPTQTWSDFGTRLYLHNVLRAYLDQQVVPALPASTSDLLAKAEPASWLPFVPDRFLCEWRDFLAQQLQPGAAAQTVEVFAARQCISPAEFYHLLGSEDRMDLEVFTRLPRQRLQAYRQRLIGMNLRLLHSYLLDGIGYIPSLFGGLSTHPGAME